MTKLEVELRHRTADRVLECAVRLHVWVLRFVQSFVRVSCGFRVGYSILVWVVVQQAPGRVATPA